MVQFTAARLREYGKDWELSRMWLCDDYMIMASNEFDLKSLNLHLVLQNTGFNQSQLVVVLRVLSQQIQTIKVITEFGPQVFQLKQPILLKDFWTHFSGHENLILPLFSLVVVFGFRCSASDTRDCGDILVRHLVKASLCTHLIHKKGHWACGSLMLMVQEDIMSNVAWIMKNFKTSVHDPRILSYSVEAGSGCEVQTFEEGAPCFASFGLPTFLQEVWQLMVLLMKRIHERPPPSKFQPQNILFSQFPDSQVWPGSISSWSLSLNKIHLQKCKLQLYSQRLDSSAVQMACFDSSSTLNPAPKCLCLRWIESVAIKSNELTRQLRKRSQVSLSWQCQSQPSWNRCLYEVSRIHGSWRICFTCWKSGRLRVTASLLFLLEYRNSPRYRRLSAPLQSMLVELIYSIMKAGLWLWLTWG